jgi:hypothetical protein
VCKSLGAREKMEACSLIARLKCDGDSTNTYDGLKLAQTHSEAMQRDGREHVNWVVLTDGKPNWGDVKDPRRLASMCAGHRTCVINYTANCSLQFSDFVTQMPGCSSVFGSDGTELHSRVVDAVDALSKPPVDLYVVHMDTEGVVSQRRINTTDFDADGSCHVLFEVDPADEHALLSVVQKGSAGTRDTTVFDAVKVVDVGKRLDSIPDPVEKARVTQLLEIERAYNRMGTLVNRVTTLGDQGDFASRGWSDVANEMQAMRIVKSETSDTPDHPLVQNSRYRSLGVAMDDVERVVSSQQASAVVSEGGAYVEVPDGRVPKVSRQQVDPGLEAESCDRSTYSSLCRGYDPDDAPVHRSLCAPAPYDDSELEDAVFRSFPPVSLPAESVLSAVVGDTRGRSPIRVHRQPTQQERNLAVQTPFRVRSVRQL